MPAVSELTSQERNFINLMNERGYRFVPEENDIVFIVAGHSNMPNELDYKDSIIFNSWLDVSDCINAHPEKKEPYDVDKADDNAVLYKNSFDFAEEFNETDLFIDSEEINIECLRDLEAYIREHFDGLKFNKEDRGTLHYPDPVHLYSKERMELALSKVVLMNKEKYSPEIQKWAESHIPYANLDKQFLQDDIQYQQKQAVYKDLNEIDPYIIEGYLAEAIPIMEKHIIEQPLIPEGIQLEGPYRYYLENADSLQDMNNRFSKMEEFLGDDLVNVEIKSEGLIYRDGFGKDHRTYGYVDSDIKLDDSDLKGTGFISSSFPKLSTDMDLNMGLKWLTPYEITKTVSDLLDNCLHEYAQKSEFKERLNEERGEAFEELTELMDKYWELDIETNFDVKFADFDEDDFVFDGDVVLYSFNDETHVLYGDEAEQAEIFCEAEPLRRKIDVIDDRFEKMINADKIHEGFDIDFIDIGKINVYGDRTREGLFDIENSPLNVVIAYNDNGFFLNEQEFEKIVNDSLPSKINGMELDVRCINPEETGSMAEFMKANKEDLDRKERECLYVKGTPVSYYSQDEKRPSFSKAMKDAKAIVKDKSESEPKIKLYRDKQEESL